MLSQQNYKLHSHAYHLWLRNMLKERKEGVDKVVESFLIVSSVLSSNRSAFSFPMEFVIVSKPHLPLLGLTLNLTIVDIAVEINDQLNDWLIDGGKSRSELIRSYILQIGRYPECSPPMLETASVHRANG
jgi:hypothetical protein